MANKSTHMPLCRLLSKAGLASRKQGTLLARAGRVTVNGVMVRDPERWVHLDSRLEVDGVMAAVKVHRVYMMNKRRGVITSRFDPAGRPVVHDHPLLRDGKLAAVGRLDMASEGLLLLTNDAQLGNRLTSPGSHVGKVYHVQIDRLLTPEELIFLTESETLDGELTRPSSWRTLRHGTKNSWLEVRLDEGKNRQIRRMLERMSVTVARLIRVQLGGIKLGDLAKGELRELRPEEVALIQ